MTHDKKHTDLTQDLDMDVNHEEVPSEGSVGGEGHRQAHEDLDIDYSNQGIRNEENMEE